MAKIFEDVPRTKCTNTPTQQCREVCENIFWCKECSTQPPPPPSLPPPPPPPPATGLGNEVGGKAAGGNLASIFGSGGSSVKIDTPQFNIKY